MDTPESDFNHREREKFVRLAELSSRDHGRAGKLQREVIAPNAASIVDAFYERLRDEPAYDAILSANAARIENIKATYHRYLMGFGVDFESPDYFRERLRIGAIHAAVGVPLSLYVAAGRLLQELITERVLARFRDDAQRRAFTGLVLKLTTLDTSLVIEVYHGTRVGSLESSVKALRARGEKLVKDLSTDALTGADSRRSVLTTLQSTLDQSRRHGRRAGIILLDLDHFKEINDRHGHSAGDMVLKLAAARIRSSLRPMDTLGRYGGEEFLVILPAAGTVSTMRIAERVQRSLNADPFDANGARMRVTASLGVTVSDGMEEPLAVIERADAGLYAAKRAGRDRIVRAGDYPADGSGPALTIRGR